jgi:hypothetical protein
MGGHQVRHQILLLARPFGQFIKVARELQIAFDMGFAHFIQNGGRAMLRRHLELSADMMLDQFTEKAFVFIQY